MKTDIVNRLRQWLSPVDDWPRRSLDDDLRDAISEIEATRVDLSRLKNVFPVYTREYWNGTDWVVSAKGNSIEEIL